jgi:mutator protein MutT
MKSSSILIAKAALFNELGQVLVLKRSGTSPNRPGLLDLPGGGFDPGESPGEAIVREIEEEIGIRLTSEQLTLGYSDTTYFDGKSTIRFVYIAEISSQDKLQLSNEHDDLYWMMWEDVLAKYDHPVYVKALKYMKEHNLLDTGLHSTR